MKEAIQTLGEAGHVGYVVGGSVRDFLLGLAGQEAGPAKDHDIATSASPDELCALFPRAITVGKAFGVIKVPVGPPAGEGVASSSVLLEIATFREDLDYQDHRHPAAVRFAGPEEDARRRDFTINALYYDPKTSRILDSVGGVEDLGARRIRAIGDPHERFREDALRLLRAVRFSARLGFAIDPETEEALRARAKLILKVSAERVRDELSLMWTGPRPALALSALASYGLLEHVLPEVESRRAHRIMELLGQLAERPSALAWAALLLEASRDAARSAPGPAAVVRAVTERMRMSREEADRVALLVEEQPKFREAFKMRESTLQRFLRQPGFEQMLALHRLDAIVTDGNLAFHEFLQTRRNEWRRMPEKSPKLLAGSDLVQLGLRPGPEFAEILRVVEDLALESKLSTKEEALEYVVRHFVR